MSDDQKRQAIALVDFLSAALLNYTVGGINIWNTPPKQNPTATDALRGENWVYGGMGRLIGKVAGYPCISRLVSVEKLRRTDASNWT